MRLLRQWGPPLSPLLLVALNVGTCGTLPPPGTGALVNGVAFAILGGLVGYWLAMWWGVWRHERPPARRRTVTRCTFDPRPLIGVPIGMFHCPGDENAPCGCMVIAGLEHGACEPDCDHYDDNDRALWDRAPGPPPEEK